VIPAIAVGVAVWTLAFIGAALLAGLVGLIVVGAFFVTTAVVGILHQRDLEAKYIVIRKDEEDR
jgi:hypothetical protein